MKADNSTTPSLVRETPLDDSTSAPSLLQSSLSILHQTNALYSVLGSVREYCSYSTIPPPPPHCSVLGFVNVALTWPFQYSRSAIQTIQVDHSTTPTQHRKLRLTIPPYPHSQWRNSSRQFHHPALQVEKLQSTIPPSRSPSGETPVDNSTIPLSKWRNSSQQLHPEHYISLVKNLCTNGWL